MFKDRIEAGRKLADVLQQRYSNDKVVVLAIPRGGLPLGAIIAKKLNAPLDVALSKKIGHPYNREYAIGAVGLTNRVLTDAMGVTRSYINEETRRIRKKLKQRHKLFYADRTPKNLKDKTVIIIDDGIATGNTIFATAELVRQQNPKEVIVAIPVAPGSAIRKLKDDPNIDEVICLIVPQDFQAVGQFFEEFKQVTDEEAVRLMRTTTG